VRRVSAGGVNGQSGSQAVTGNNGTFFDCPTARLPDCPTALFAEVRHRSYLDEKPAK
jgi:hypothetical protein